MAAADASLTLSWTAPAGSVDHYQIERSQSISGPFLSRANAATTKNLFGVFLLVFCVCEARAKKWRDIVPLKSNRTDVERLLGKPNELGRYQIQNEIVTIWYSEGPCESMYGGLAKADCECLVVKDTVLKIAVTFDSPVRVSKLGIDTKKYERTRVDAAYRPTATYSDFTEGAVYTIR